MADHKSPRDEFDDFVREVTEMPGWKDLEHGDQWQASIDERLAREYLQSLRNQPEDELLKQRSWLVRFTTRAVVSANLTVLELHMSKRAPKPLTRLALLTDLIPLPATRKLQKKFLADEAAEILELKLAGRIGASRWRAGCAWVIWVGYLLRAPLNALLRVAFKSHTS